MKLLSTHYCVIFEKEQFFIFREMYVFNCFSLCGEIISEGFDSLLDAELRLEEIITPKTIELL